MFFSKKVKVPATEPYSRNLCFFEKSLSPGYGTVLQKLVFFLKKVKVPGTEPYSKNLCFFRKKLKSRVRNRTFCWSEIEFEMAQKMCKHYLFSKHGLNEECLRIWAFAHLEGGGVNTKWELMLSWDWVRVPGTEPYSRNLCFFRKKSKSRVRNRTPETCVFFEKN